MRLLMLFSIGFCGSCGICAYLAWNDPILWLEMAAVCCCLFCAGLCLRKRPFRAAAVCLLGMALGSLWYWCHDSMYLSAARRMDQMEVKASVTITDYSFPADYGVAADGEIELDGKVYQLRIYLSREVSLKPGDTVTGTFQMRFTSTGGKRNATYHRGEGKFLLAYGRKDCQITYGSEQKAVYLPARLRHRVLTLIPELFPEDMSAFASALLIGQDDDLTYEENTALKLSGIRHVVAVSGQHLVILMGAVMFLTGRARRLAYILSVPILIVFSAMCGLTPSIMRACIMQLLLILAFLAKKEYDALTALAFSVLCMVVVNPLAITSVSLQLSAASVLGMFLYTERIYQRILSWRFTARKDPKARPGKIHQGIAATVSVTLASMVVTLPLSAVYFQTVSLVSVVTNLLTLWLITLVFYGVIAAVLVGLVWAPAGACLGYVLAFAMRFIMWVSRTLAAIPGGCLYLRNEVIVIAAIIAYGILLLCLYSKGLRLWQAGCCISAVLAIGLAISWMLPRQDNYRITMLDVGQGQCILLQSGQRSYVVDCGGDYSQQAADSAAETLLSMGISRIDGLILTHFDIDHSGGAEYLLTRITADSIILPQTWGATQTPPWIYSGNSQVWTIQEDLSATWGHSKITIFAPNGGENGNEMGLCVLFQSGNCDILITGDRPKAQELELLSHVQLPKLDYLVAGHHGANSSTGPSLLAATRPETVLISVGRDNRYGHPKQELLERLQSFGCRILRTDHQGTIIIRG